MHRGICRSALIASGVAALAAFTAGPALAAGPPIVATTGAVTAVTATTATFSGTVNPAGNTVPTPWIFSYCIAGTNFGCTYTTGGMLPAGGTTPVPVTDTATGLTPSTAYTVELIAQSPGSGGFSYLVVPIYGAPPVPFTTTGPGAATLGSTKLKVAGGRVEVPFKCAPALACSGGMVSITTKSKGKTVACGSASFSVAAGAKAMVNTSKISPKCKALLMGAPTKKGLGAKLSAMFTYQAGINASVTLKLAKK
jgi:hypothetical protein